jgi:hypothetical protein
MWDSVTTTDESVKFWQHVRLAGLAPGQVARERQHARLALVAPDDRLEGRPRLVVGARAVMRRRLVERLGVLRRQLEAAPELAGQEREHPLAIVEVPFRVARRLDERAQLLLQVGGPAWVAAAAGPARQRQLDEPAVGAVEVGLAGVVVRVHVHWIWEGYDPAGVT